jgi:SAM-dependent methyltransferase
MTIPVRFEWTREPGVGSGVEVLGPLAGRVVIEMGCGSGHNLAHLAAVRGAVGIGIDRDPVKIARARGLYGQTDNLAFILGDAADILAAMPPALTDVCLSIFGALSFSSPAPILSEAARVLRPGGRLAVTMRADDHRDYVTILMRKEAVE